MVFAALFITNRCNLRCKMCDYWKEKRDKSELTPKQWKKVLDDLKVNRVHIVGMEPLLYKEFDELLKIIKPGRHIMLTTNGQLLDKHIDAISKYCDNTAVSLDGLADAHDRIRCVKGAFDKAFGSLLQLSFKGAQVRVSFAVTPDNTDQIIPLYLKLWKHKIPMIINQFNFIHPSSCNGFDCAPSNMSDYDPKDVNLEELHDAIKQCKHARFYPHLKDMNELKAYYLNPPTKRKRKGCPILDAMVRGDRYTIRSNGDFYPPGRAWYIGKMGNALKMDLLPKDTKWLKEMNEDIKKNGLPPPCQRLCCAGKVL